jgi:Icc-related predicted phosphoesterase
LTPDEKEALDASPQKIEAAFHAAVLQSIQRWVALSDERLSQTGVPGFVILGNDDFPEVADPFAAAHHLTYAEERICELPGGWELLSFGYSTPTPWDTPRELSEEEIGKRLEALAGKLHQPDRAIFNIHCPPRDTHLDQAPKLDDELRMVPSVGGVELASVGSTAVRSIIEQYRPPLALHGHVHDSAAAQKLGSTLCINPGSTYGEGVLRGAFVELSTDGDVQRWQLVEA